MRDALLRSLGIDEDLDEGRFASLAWN